jgi:hypothetical protein
MTPKLLAAAAATLLCAIPAFAQTSPPVDPSSKTQAESPTTKGRGLGDQPAGFPVDLMEVNLLAPARRWVDQDRCRDERQSLR